MSDNGKLPLKKYLKNYRWLMILAIFMSNACSQIDEETQAKIDYWDKQADIMILQGPQKGKVFAWVYAIDPDAKYSGDSLIVKLETLNQAEAPSLSCIILSIGFDERERVKAHKVTLEKQCN
ncbi:hypothetical protein [Paraglaciecola sp.]|uniref:hypothetical protein n=1 Tax=Paraglaciecola sp. TaxID=1920173 RepID=UPI0030F47310